MSELLDALEKCKQSARHGYNIAKEQTSSLSHTLAAAEDRVQSTLTAFDQSICYDAESSRILRTQLLDIQQSFETLSYTFKDHLEDLHQNLSQFTIAVFGKTKTGKSTLMETLIHGNGDSIGKGAQRTTQDVRTYTWNNLHIIDMPGVLAVQGDEDNDIAYNAAKSADLIIFLLSDDNPSSEEAEWLIRVKRLGKPIIILINIKFEVPEDPENKVFLFDLKEAFSEERLNQFKNQFISFAISQGQDISYIPFVYAHLDLAFKADKITDPEKKRVLEKLSRIGILQQQIINQVIEKGSFLRKKTFIDDISAPMLDSFENLLYDHSHEKKQLLYLPEYCGGTESDFRTIIFRRIQ